MTEKLKDGSGGEAAGEGKRREGLTPCEVVAVRLAEDAQTAVGGPRVQGGEGRGWRWRCVSGVEREERGHTWGREREQTQLHHNLF